MLLCKFDDVYKMTSDKFDFILILGENDIAYKNKAYQVFYIHGRCVV